MGGDCAETFAEATADHVRLKIQTLPQMAAVLTYASAAGHQGRSYRGSTPLLVPPTWSRSDGVTLPTAATRSTRSVHLEAREPRPAALLSLYNHAVRRWNLIRAFTKGGLAPAAGTLLESGSCRIRRMRATSQAGR